MHEGIGSNNEATRQPVRLETGIGVIELTNDNCCLQFFGPGYEYMDHVEIRAAEHEFPLGVLVKRDVLNKLLEFKFPFDINMEPSDADIAWFMKRESERFDKEVAAFLPAE